MKKGCFSGLSVLLAGMILLPGFSSMSVPASAESMYEAPEPIFEGLKEGREFTTGPDSVVESGVSVQVGSVFTLSADLKTESASGVQVLFAKGPKEKGHFELWLSDGKLAFYAPEINGNGSIYTDIFVADGQEHSVMFTYKNGKWGAYLDHVKRGQGSVSGAVSPFEAELSLGSLTDGSCEYIGYLKNVQIYDTCLDVPLKEVSVYEALGGGALFGAGADSYVEETFTINVGSVFTLSAVLKTESVSGVQVLFAKGPKEEGHFELWLFDGKLAFYAPEINGNGSIYTDIFVADGQEHHVAFTYDDGVWYAYLDGSVQIGGVTAGTVSDKADHLVLGSLADGSYEYIGSLANVRIEKQALPPSQLKVLMPDSVEPAPPYAPAERVSRYTPDKYSPAGALRGAGRFSHLVALPYVDLSATTGYTGSISKSGDNADWDWGMYQDEKGDWVLFEAYGAGCLYNFTQHRYPTSEEPTFYFYIDDGETPAYAIKQSEFGKKAPFLSPVSGIYEGPEDGGIGPIWVVRSFVPMEFTSYCRVTSSVKLEGNDKAKGEGGWGHVDYVLYDTPKDLKAFDAENQEGLETLFSLSQNVTFDPKYAAENEILKKKDITVKAGTVVDLFDYSGEGSVACVKLTLKDDNADPKNLNALRIRLYWDGAEKAAVDAPIGAFFGNEYGYTRCDNTLLMLGMEMVPMAYFKGYNYFPMPFWHSMKMELYSLSDTDMVVSEAEVQVTPDEVCRYDRAAAGYFVSSLYYEKTPNTEGRNSCIAEMNGTGHMVYGVLSGYGIHHGGCEGDVRVFFDGRQSPEMESDGSESWASYGWGFVTPPQSNPFSGYNGLPNANSDWSEVRLTLGDSYFFKTSLRFELEHGPNNNGMGSHSGQIFCYMLADEASRSRVTDQIDFCDEENLQKHRFRAAGDLTSERITSAYANGINMANAFPGTVYRSEGAVTFEVSLDARNQGVLLNRTFSQREGRQAARIYVDGVEVQERIWYSADSNEIYCWADDSFQIPAEYTAGKDTASICIEPVAADGKAITWNATGYKVISIMGIARSGANPDTITQQPGETTIQQSSNTTSQPSGGPAENPTTGQSRSWRLFPFMTLSLLLLGIFIGFPLRKRGLS